MEAQPVAQAQQPSQPVILDLMPLDHLGLSLPARIEAVQRVEHQISIVTSWPVEGHDRVEHDQIAGPRDHQGIAPRRAADARRSERCS